MHKELRYIFAFCIGFMLIDECNSFSESFWRLRDLVERQRQRILESKPNQIQIPVQYFSQPLDHFNPSIEGTIKQRYWINDQYWTTFWSDGPVFLFIGGEGTITNSSVLKGEHVELALKFSALIIAVEHRYYGNSTNDNSLLLENIQYLSSQQALADLASFHSFVVEKYHLKSTTKWICFGGSYPGALSAWFRLKYPHLVYGAIASSAPVKAVTNFEGYNDVVAASMSDQVVGGSQQCAASIRTAFDKLTSLIQTGEVDILDRDFKSCSPSTESKDIYQLVSNVAGIIMGIVQYNNEVPGLNISSVCTIMADTNVDPYANLKQLNMKYLNATHTNCSNNSWMYAVSQLDNTTVVRTKLGVGLRQWIYQTCTQFGYYQTCDMNTTCLFSPYLDLKSNLDICEQVFKVLPEEVYSRVSFTNEYYGADQPRGSRIVFVNGSIDPWHALSVLHNETSDELSIYINGTAHCANMLPNRKGDPKSLIFAREEISSIIEKWLKS